MSSRAWVLFAASSVIWGVPYFFIKVAVDADVPPAFVAWSRIALGAVILLPLALHRGAFAGLGGHWRAVVAYAAVEITVPFTLIAIGEQHVSSSLAAILISSMPLMVALMSLRLTPHDRPDAGRLLGLFLGLAGVVALLGIDVAGDADELLGAVLVLIATLGYATAPFIVEGRLSKLDPIGPVTMALCISAVVLLPAAIAAPPGETPSLDAAGSLVALGAVCTALGLLVFFELIKEAGPSRASVITYVNPVVAVALGVAILDEELSAISALGLAAILAGSWLATAGERQQVAAAGPS